MLSNEYKKNYRYSSVFSIYFVWSFEPDYTNYNIVNHNFRIIQGYIIHVGNHSFSK